ncbi:radical SAM protein [Acidithiobacillus thiooxidans]|jgi:radical SAM protein with 4Fe4S-binding SPASM domain|nr:radical SAM protein [Acidithiobacillus thiooxidans]MDX5936852.1 radical SAM protein [Acidithiobacillus thiooxidans]MDX5936894.1 radical SAM protein [Acidithiobacillus thiooxidans]
MESTQSILMTLEKKMGNENIIKDRIEHYKKPYRLHLETTNHCNLHCEHCYRGSSSAEPHHPTGVLDNILDESRRLGVKKITLTGGEILTHPDWKHIISKSLDSCDNIYFITNGLLLTKTKLEWLAKQKTIRSVKKWRDTLFRRRPVEIGLAISLDGLNSNQLVRKNDSGSGVKYTQILEKIALAVKYGLRVTVNTTVTNSNTAKELPEMYDILSNIGIDRWQIDQAYIAGRLTTSNLRDDNLKFLDDAKSGYKYIISNYLRSYPKIPDWRLEIVQVFRYDTLFYGFKAANLTDHPCDYHFGSLIVEQGDKIRFCPSLREQELGQLTTTIEKAYNNEDFNDFISKSILDLPCSNCRYGKLFHGGCRANSLAYTGKTWNADPICCSLSPFVEKEIVPLLPKKIKDSFYACLQDGPRPGEPEHAHSHKKIVIPIKVIN